MEKTDRVAELKKEIEKLKPEINGRKQIPAKLQIIELYNRNNKTQRVLEDDEFLDEIKDENVYELTVIESM